MPAVRQKADDKVTELELFFDLVFVFAITQVTALMAHEGGWAGIGRGMLVLSLLWFAWSAFAWLTNMVDADEGGGRAAMFVTMIGLLIVSLAVPHAFDDDALIFGVAYFGVRLMQIVVYGFGDANLGALARTIGPWMVVPGLMIVGAGLVEGTARYTFWIAAIVINLVGPFVSDRSQWQVNPGHFSERHGLFVIIALGESIVAAGVGIEGQPLDAELLLAASLAVVVAAALWWTYFDIGVHVAGRRLAQLQGDERGRMARDSYTFIHWPMVAGIVLFALGIKKTLAHVDEPLEPAYAAALCGGTALYAAGQVAFRIRNVGQLSRRRSVLTVALVALVPIAHEVDAIVALALVAVAWWTLIAYELLRYGEQRDRLRHTEEMPA